MEGFLEQINKLIVSGQVRISDHGYEELADDGLYAREVIEGISSAEVIEEYPEYPKGSCILVKQLDSLGNIIHVVWGIPKGQPSPVVLVTAYRPDPKRWSVDFTRRMS